MKNKYSIISAIALVSTTLFLGCSKDSKADMDEALDTASSKISESAEATSEWFSQAWDKISNFTVDQKDEFVETLSESYSKVSDEAKSLIDQNDVSDEAVEKFNNASRALKNKLDAAGDATADGWDATKRGLKKAWSDFKAAFEKLKSEATS